MNFLPVDMSTFKTEYNTDRPDFVLVTGDAYVDHPSFGASIIGRLLVKEGFSVGVIAQPDWRNDESFAVFGKPRLGFLVTGGNIDSMVNHYTVAKKPREKDLYSPGGQTGLRPDRATIVYGNRIRACYKDTAIIIGGLEASLRRFSHYDYWDNKVRRSILLDASADLLAYGMAEVPMLEIAQALDSGLPISEITFINGTVYKTKDLSRPADFLTLPEFKLASRDKTAYARSFMMQYENTDHITAKTLVEPYPECFVVQNIPAASLTGPQFDNIYALPYMNAYHPMYEQMGGVPALSEVKFSLTSNRGCFGGCNFCALTFHQGRVVQARSHESLVHEAEKMTRDADFKGYIHDVGGPTANFRFPSCEKQLTKGVCKNKQCLFPVPCKKLKINHVDYLTLLGKLRALPRVKKVFVRSGLRYDYMLLDQDETFLKTLCEHHISGQLKVAPEHITPKVLEKMGKPGKEVYERFVERYTYINRKLDKKQFLVPYLMSSHPGSDLTAAIELAEYLRDTGTTPRQVQDFYPTPGTLSTAMYHTALDPRTMEPVFVPKTPHDKAMQRALLQYRLPQNYALVMEALKKAKRFDLIGFDKKCFIRPRQTAPAKTGVQHATKPKAKKKTIRNIHKKVR